MFACVHFRKTSQHWELWADSALRNVQCPKRQNAVASEPMDKTPGYPVWDVLDSIICERQLEWKDACSATNWWKSKCKTRMLKSISVFEGRFSHFCNKREMDLACLNSYFLILVTRTVKITIPLDHERK